MNTDERFECLKKDVSFLEVYSWYLQLTEKEQEDFLRLIAHYNPSLYKRADMGQNEKRCFSKGDCGCS